MTMHARKAARTGETPPTQGRTLMEVFAEERESTAGLPGETTVGELPESFPEIPQQMKERFGDADDWQARIGEWWSTTKQRLWRDLQEIRDRVELETNERISALEKRIEELEKHNK